MKIILIPLLVGLIGGMIGALCGVGGGIIMVPAFVYLLGMEQKLAVATSMAVIAPVAAVSIFNFTTDNLVQWKIFIPTAIGAVISAYYFSDKMKAMSNETLTRTFAVILIVAGISMLFKPVPKGSTGGENCFGRKIPRKKMTEICEKKSLHSQFRARF